MRLGHAIDAGGEPDIARIVALERCGPGDARDRNTDVGTKDDTDPLCHRQRHLLTHRRHIGTPEERELERERAADERLAKLQAEEEERMRKEAEKRRAKGVALAEKAAVAAARIEKTQAQQAEARAQQIAQFEERMAAQRERQRLGSTASVISRALRPAAGAAARRALCPLHNYSCV